MKKFSLKSFGMHLLSLFVILNVIAFVPLLFGWSYNIVLSDSMSPTIHKGDLVLVQPIDNAHYQAGDIALYLSKVDQQAVHVLHRIQEKTKTPDGFVHYFTKGDANATADQNSIPSDQLKGRYVAKIPMLGTPIKFVRENHLMTFAILAALAVSFQIQRMGRRSVKTGEQSYEAA